MKKLLYLSLSVALLLIAISIAYYFVVFLPKKEEMALRLDQERIAQQKQDLKEKNASSQPSPQVSPVMVQSNDFPLSAAEIGRQIKAAFPNSTYVNLSDEMVGEMYLRKYR